MFFSKVHGNLALNTMMHWKEDAFPAGICAALLPRTSLFQWSETLAPRRDLLQQLMLIQLPAPRIQVKGVGMPAQY